MFGGSVEDMLEDLLCVHALLADLLRLERNPCLNVIHLLGSFAAWKNFAQAAFILF